MSDKQAALDELDREFNSAENCRTGQINYAGYIARKRLIESKPDDSQLAPLTKATQPNGSRAVSWKALTDVMEKLVDSVLGKFKTNEDRIDELARRISKLEEKHLKYCGVYQDGQTYLGNDLVTWHGSLWICVVLSTKDRPGTDSWKMMTKTSR